MERLFAISLSAEWSRIVFFFPDFTIFFTLFIGRTDAYFFAAYRSPNRRVRDAVIYCFTTIMPSPLRKFLAAFILFLVREGIWREQKQIFFTKNVKEKFDFLNI